MPEFWKNDAPQPFLDLPRGESQVKVKVPEGFTRLWLPCDTNQELVIETAERMVGDSLVSGRSIFVPGREIWTPQAFDQVNVVLDNAVPSHGHSFIEQLQLQFAEESDDVKLLVAEILALQVLPVSGSIGQKAKFKRVSEFLKSMQSQVQIPEYVVHGFTGGSYGVGASMQAGISDAFRTFVSGLSAIVHVEGSDRATILEEDPIALRKLLQETPGLPTKSGWLGSQMYSLMYTIHPTFFGPIVSHKHRRLVRETFIGELTAQTGDVDVDLKSIAIALQVKKASPINFYRGEIKDKWDPSKQSRKAREDDTKDDGTLPAEDLNDDVKTQSVPPDLTQLPLDKAAGSLLVSRDWLEKVIRSLARRKQVILYGPPGTGKTFIAKRLAEKLVKYNVEDAKGTIMRLQFHPSYSYEDFFDGYRPRVGVDGRVEFHLVDGPLKQIAAEATANPDLWHVLLIDEINRANLPKVFGELYYLLEYRSECVQTMYGGEQAQGETTGFALPKNLLIIGTMNTSDRSIALLDAAMRRRFDFFELHPDTEPIKGILRRWQQTHKAQWSYDLASLMDQVNANINEHDDKIGPSSLFLKPEDATEERLTEIWEQNILPLLQERQPGERLELKPWYGLLEQ